jgi:hypothetical protein
LHLEPSLESIEESFDDPPRRPRAPRSIRREIASPAVTSWMPSRAADRRSGLLAERLNQDLDKPALNTEPHMLEGHRSCHRSALRSR